MPSKSQLIAAAKAGAYAEFVGERLYNRYAAPYVKKYSKMAYRRYIRPTLRSMYRRRPIKPLYIKRRRLAAVTRSRKRKRLGLGRQFIGYARGASVSQNNAVLRDTSTFTMESKRVYSTELTRIPLTSIGQTERRSLTLYCSGFKVCCELNNIRSTSAYFNMAVVTYKNDTSDLNRFDPGVANNAQGAQTLVDFFRDHGTVANQRAVNMNNSLTGMECACLPINTDAYKILMHKRYKLGPGNGTQPGPDFNNGSNGRCQLTINRWIPMRRQFRYEGNEDTSCTTPLFLIMWCSEFQEATGFNVPLMMQRYMRVTTYFRNKQN